MRSVTEEIFCQCIEGIVSKKSKKILSLHSTYIYTYIQSIRKSILTIPLSAGPDANGRLVGDPGITLGVLARRPLSDINFSEYTDFALESIRKFKLEIRPGGLAPQEDLEIWHNIFKNNFETREGNVLSCTHGSFAREFWPIIYNYHACGDTGDAGWNKLFNRLKSEGYPKSIIPCRVCLRQDRTAVNLN